MTLIETWINFWQTPKYRKNLIISSLIFIVFMACLTLFLEYIESRPYGYYFNDPILNNLGPWEVSLWIALFQYSAIAIMIYLCLSNPKNLCRFFHLFFIVFTMRCITLYFIPLYAPQDILPLQDPFLDNFIYLGNRKLRDLFFSGHVASVVMFGLLAESKRLQTILFVLAVIVGFLLSVQHVHYSIDVIAAPFFAIVGNKLRKRYIGDL